MLLNPGVELNLRGLSVDHVVAEGVLTDICQPSDPRLVDLSNPELKVFNPWAPFVAADSEETESDVRDEHVRVPSGVPGAEVVDSAPDGTDGEVETIVVVPPPGP
jgi:hypothetical protein